MHARVHPWIKRVLLARPGNARCFGLPVRLRKALPHGPEFLLGLRRSATAWRLDPAMAGFQPTGGRLATTNSLPGGNAAPKPRRTIVLVGLMGAGKTSVGRRLAKRLDLPFVDADEEIARTAGLSVSEIFERFGEQAFRDAERRAIARLLSEDTKVLATGGGAFLDAATQQAIAERGLSVWLRAELDVLVERTIGRRHRPLLNSGDPRATLAALMAARYPVYALADLIVDTIDGPIEQTVERVEAALAAYFAGKEGNDKG